MKIIYLLALAAVINAVTHFVVALKDIDLPALAAVINAVAHLVVAFGTA